MRRGRIVLSAAGLGAALALGAPAAASAVVYCVDNPSCPGGGVSQATLQGALDTAEASTTVADEIRLGPGTFTDPDGVSFAYDGGADAANDITIRGAGPGQTILTQSQTDQILLRFESHSGQDRIVSDLTARAPDGMTRTFLFLPTQVSRVDLEALGSMPSGLGIHLGGNPTSSVSDVAIRFPKTGSNEGIYQPNGTTSIVLGTIVAAHPLTGFGTNNTYRKLRIDGGQTGIDLDLAGTTTMEDIQVSFDGPGFALRHDVPFADSTLNASHLTLRGNGAAGSTGLETRTSETGPKTATTNLSNSVITGFEHALSRSVLGGGTSADVAVKNSVLPFAGWLQSGTGAITADATNADAADARLAADPAGFLFPRFDSPALERADPAFTTSTTDLSGAERVVDADGNGVPTPDAGALEYRRRPPVAVISPFGTAPAGLPAAFSGAGSSDPDPGDALTFAWSFSDGGSASGADVTHTFAAPGTAGAGLKVRDPMGLEATTSATVTVADVTGAEMANPGMRRSRFRVSGAATAVTAVRRRLPPRGSAFLFTLSERATVRIAIDRLLVGRRSRGKCVRPTRSNRRRARCTRAVRAGTLTRRNLAAGRRTVAFSGRIGHRALRPGRYRAALKATDSAGNTGRERRLAFTIVRG
jgi:hypothetical protein